MGDSWGTPFTARSGRGGLRGPPERVNAAPDGGRERGVKSDTIWLSITSILDRSDSVKRPARSGRHYESATFRQQCRGAYVDHVGDIWWTPAFVQREVAPW
jgi:hypothetical protein